MNITSGYHSGLKKQYGGDRVINKEITAHSPENGGLDCMMRAEESGHDGTTMAHWGESDSRHRFQAYAKNLKC